MTISNKMVFGKAYSKVIGGKGLFLALALAGAAFQGCTTEDKAAGPDGADAAPAVAIREDESGADLDADGTPVNPDLSDAGEPRALAKAAPSCVYLYPSQTIRGYRYARAQNRCATPVRIRFIWRYNFDGPCTQVMPISAGYRYELEENRSWPSYLTEVRGC